MKAFGSYLQTTANPKGRCNPVYKGSLCAKIFPVTGQEQCATVKGASSGRKPIKQISPLPFPPVNLSGNSCYLSSLYNLFSKIFDVQKTGKSNRVLGKRITKILRK